jgi:outer membrane immunogenic protein
MNKNTFLLSSAVSMLMLGASGISLGAAPMLMGPTTGVLGPYVGIQAGIGGMDTKKLSETSKTLTPYTQDVNDWDFFTGRIFGGYLWSQDAFSYGLELGGMMYPKNKYSVTDGTYDLVKYQYKGYTVDLLGVAKYSLANNFYVFGKAGVAYVTQEYKQEVETTAGDIPATFEKTKRKFLPEIAGGVGYNFNNMDVDVTYAHVFGSAPKEYSDAANLGPTSDDLYKKVATVNALMLGVTYHLGR